MPVLTQEMMMFSMLKIVYIADGWEWDKNHLGILTVPFSHQR